MSFSSPDVQRGGVLLPARGLVQQRRGPLGPLTDAQVPIGSFQSPLRGGGTPQTPPDTQTSGGGGLQPSKGGRPSKKGQLPSPFDAEYYTNVANFLFKTNNAIAQDQQTVGDDRTALQAALGQLQAQQPQAALALMEKANQSGALYSTPYAQQQGNLENVYATKAGGLSSATEGKIAALTAAIAGLRGAVPLYENAQAVASAQRLAAAAAKNPALGESTYPLNADRQTSNELQSNGPLVDTQTGGLIRGATVPLEHGSTGRFDPLARADRQVRRGGNLRALSRRLAGGR